MPRLLYCTTVGLLAALSDRPSTEGPVPVQDNYLCTLGPLDLCAAGGPNSALNAYMEHWSLAK